MNLDIKEIWSVTLDYDIRNNQKEHPVRRNRGPAPLLDQGEKAQSWR
jgi:hypothetical protein